MSAEKLFTAASAVAEALASDDLSANNARIPALHEAAMATVDALGASGGRLGESAHVGPAKDLKEARKQFYPLSMAIAELAMHARPAGNVKVFECPMAKSAVPSAETNQGRWVQRTGPIRNPFFGAEMLECGKEVQP
jgi:Cu(I)/Ag(I) efflux system membrane fusion protein